MKTFKSFISEAGPNVKPKAKGEADFVAAHEVEITDKTDQDQNSAKVATKEGSGKRKADKLDNKQAMGESKSYRKMMKSMKEADFTKKQTTMAHTIGKEFEKKGVGDEAKGGPYAVASAMVKDKPEAAQKAYATIKAKMKEDISTEILFKLYEELNEENQQFFMVKLEEDAESLLDFAMSQVEAE